MDNGFTINPVSARKQFREQLATITSSDLHKECEKFFIGINGGKDDVDFIRQVSPKEAIILEHGTDAKSLIPTLQHLQKHLPEYEGCAVGFGHTKGITQPNSPGCIAWRACMMRWTVSEWRIAVRSLENFYDVTGCHWVNNDPNDSNADRWGANSYFAGVFWWARSSYLKILPPFPEKVTDRQVWFMPELWLGNGKPKVMDFHTIKPPTPGQFCGEAARTCLISATR